MTCRMPLDLRRPDFAGSGRASPRFLSGRSFRRWTDTTPTPALFPSAALFVYRLPGPLLGDALRGASLFAILLDMFGLAFLLVRIFDFGSSWHDSPMAKAIPTQEICISPLVEGTVHGVER
jgi:hypothetical protein